MGRDSQVTSSVISHLNFDNDEIRATNDGRISVFDFIRVVGGQKSPREVWKRLLKNYPEYCHISAQYSFGGKGGAAKKTLVATKEETLQILNLLPGLVGKEYRQEAAKIVLGFLNADASIALSIIDRSNSTEDIKRIELRAKAKLSNLGLNAAIKSCGGVKVYPVVADINNVAVTGQTAKDIKMSRNVKQTRDGMSRIELMFIEAAEVLQESTLRSDRPFGDKEIVSTCREVAFDIAGLMKKYIKPSALREVV